MTTLLSFGRDVQGLNAYAPQPAQDKWGATITTGAATNITVPSNYQMWIAVFSFQPGSSVWVDFSGAIAAIPPSGTLLTTTSELNPGAREILAGSNISIITGNASVQVGIALYAIKYL